METEKIKENVDTILTWNAPEFIKHPRGILWFCVMGLMVSILIWYAVSTNSLTMAIAFIVLAGVYAIAHHREPALLKIRVTSIGIEAGKKKIPYNQVKAFWIVYDPPFVQVLKLLTTDKFMPEMTLQLDGQAPGQLRDYLIRRIPEYEGKSESLVDTIIRIAKL
ncbi:MAG: hypothetical protein UT55_C0002G0003 [Candidatus Peregrinibacteria bacterium GW2011_GWE2_39_6]|nr:MAG: hypothetical protein UT36_C0002G0055 [Candidatus Peregrinibacteria bacterium GW2011_GWF2_39_17]KKR26741.1 MAG: hypothetical protein UT55_C0002G0003 [Candidatus Peregrinibacteria bacterium GW2011_GWE2_39_6]HCW32159.1 hypothetical protein [Candidatus Peregrinibacteria bacterium]